MKRINVFQLIGLVALCILCMAPFVPNTFTENNPGQFPTLLPTPANTDNAKVVLHVDGKGDILESATAVYSNGVWLGTLQQVWTNDVASGSLIYPAGTVQNITTPFYFNPTGGGSLLLGTNVNQDLSGGIQYAVDLVSMLDSNEPPNLQLQLNAIDSENYLLESIFSAHVSASHTVPTASLVVGAYGNTAANHALNFLADPASSSGGTLLSLVTNISNKTVWQVDSNGLVTANGFVDNSGSVGSIVAYGAGKRLIATNINTVVSNTTFTVVNTTDIHVTGKATFNQIIITNGFFSQTNVWPGPTNTLDVSIYNQGYATVVPLAITGFINASNTLGSEVKLKIKNNAATNVTIYFTAAGDTDRDHVTSQIITNGTVAQIWYNVDPGEGGSTNHVFNDF